MKLSDLKPPKGAVKSKKRVGCGTGSGHGCTSCRGNKGQRSRSGGGVPPWFEGGQMPLQRRLPKRGFVNIFRKEYTLVHLDRLNAFPSGSEVGVEELLREGIIRKVKDGVKILGDGELKVPLTVSAHKFTRSAVEKIEKAGGKIKEL
ncbi:MAG: 50S ribosomal protein L15 [Deltaproteobacteria bacterium]|nr:MAG: 50S ribosomal protein L15 [Deltaproteobacteria bacterium]